MLATRVSLSIRHLGYIPKLRSISGFGVVALGSSQDVHSIYKSLLSTQQNFVETCRVRKTLRSNFVASPHFIALRATAN